MFRDDSIEAVSVVDPPATTRPLDDMFVDDSVDEGPEGAPHTKEPGNIPHAYGLAEARTTNWLLVCPKLFPVMFRSSLVQSGPRKKSVLNLRSGPLWSSSCSKTGPVWVLISKYFKTPVHT